MSGWIDRKFGPASLGRETVAADEYNFGEWSEWRAEVDADRASNRRRIRRQNRAGSSVCAALALGAGVILWGGDAVVSQTELAAPSKLAVTAPPPVQLTPTTAAYVAQYVAPPTTPPTTRPAPTTTTAPPIDRTITVAEFRGEWRIETGPGFYSPAVFAGLHPEADEPGGPWSVIGVPAHLDEVDIGHTVTIGGRSWEVYRAGTTNRAGQLDLFARTDTTPTVVLYEAIRKHDDATLDVRNVRWLRS